MAGHVVTAPLVIASDAEGRHVYLYEGQPVPAGIPAAEVKRLVEGGFLSQGQPEEPPYPSGDPAESWKVEELRRFADERSIDLGDASKKADILAAIVAAKA